MNTAPPSPQPAPNTQTKATERPKRCEVSDQTQHQAMRSERPFKSDAKRAKAKPTPRSEARECCFGLGWGWQERGAPEAVKRSVAGGAVPDRTRTPNQKTKNKPLFVNNHAANILPIPHILIPLVDLLQRIGLGDQLIKLQLSGLVETEQLWNIGTG